MIIDIGRDAKHVPESEALDYVLGYTAANDVSSRTSQMNQSQWFFSKVFDGACPIGPVLVSTSLVPDVSKSAHSRSQDRDRLMYMTPSIL